MSRSARVASLAYGIPAVTQGLGAILFLNASLFTAPVAAGGIVAVSLGLICQELADALKHDLTTITLMILVIVMGAVMTLSLAVQTVNHTETLIAFPGILLPLGLQTVYAGITHCLVSDRRIA